MPEAKTDIDFVIIWVDGSDPKWLARKAQYKGEDHAQDSGVHRYRDWGLLKYWFRSVEENAPWVRKIHLVTCGQVPDWLDTSNPRLNLVDHADYIPAEFLPTFNSKTIELNLHRIEELAEHFVYFNDDFFLGAPIRPEDCFQDGLPVDLAALNVFNYSLNEPTQLCVVRNVGVINKHFNMKDVLRENRGKWINLKAGKYLLRTLILRHSPGFTGFVIHHCALPFLKSTFEEVWEKEPELLRETCSHRFRELTDVNCWVMKEWQLASGTFVPASAGKYRYYALENVQIAQAAAETIRKRKTPFFCLNDYAGLSAEEFEEASGLVQAAFEAAYPKPSSFEKQG